MTKLPKPTSEWTAYEKYFHKLISTDLSSTNLREWLKAWSEVEKLIRGLEIQLRVAAYADTTDREAKKAFAYYSEHLLPNVAKANHVLKGKFLTAVSRVTSEEFGEMIKTFKAEMQLYSDENVPLLAGHDVLSEKYGQLVGDLEVGFNDEVCSLSEITPLIESKERDIREQAWKARWQALLNRSREIENLFISLLKLRLRIARNAGFKTYLDYKWLDLGRFDYTPDDNVRLAEAIESEATPLLVELRDRRKAYLDVENLRPWDLLVYPFKSEVASPFKNARDVFDKAVSILTKIDPDMTLLLESMDAHGTIDMELRENKLLTDIGDYDYIRNLPVIFTYCTGGVYDLNYFLHEFGHAFHFDLSMKQPLYWQQWGRLEVMELSAQTLELLKLPHLGNIFSETEVAKLKFLTFEKILSDLTLVPVLDLFQQWAYRQPPDKLTIQVLDEKYVELVDRFMPGIEWSGLEQEKAKGWFYKHLFQYPLYFVEYGYAWVGALDIYGRYLRQPESTLRAFKDALALGTSRPVSDIYSCAGTSFPARHGDVKRMVSIIRDELSGL